MGLIVETGTGIADANSYIDTDFADAYLEDRGRAAWALLDDQAKSVALIKATDSIDSLYPWIGKKKTAIQGLKWPRIEGKTAAGVEIQLSDSDGFGIDGVPSGLKNAVAEAAFLISTGEELFQDTDPRGKILRKKTDVLETEYQPDSPIAKPAGPTAFGALNALLKGLYALQTGGMTIGKAVRG